MKVTTTKNYGHEKLKCIVFGQSGSGKTTMLGTANEPMLIISAESGLLSLSGKDIDVIELQKNDDGEILAKESRITRLMEVYKWFSTSEEAKKYKWLAIDSLTEIGQNLTEKLQKDFPDRKDAIVMWGEYSKGMRGLIKAFRDLPVNVIFTALAVEDRDDNGKKQIHIDLQGKIGQQLPQFFDEVFFLYNRQHEDGSTQREILCNPVESCVYAKDRSGKLSKIEKPDLSLLAGKIRK